MLIVAPIRIETAGTMNPRGLTPLLREMTYARKTTTLLWNGGIRRRLDNCLVIVAKRMPSCPGDSCSILIRSWNAASGVPPRGKNEPSETPLIPLGPALVGNPVCQGQEEHSMRETKVKSEIPVNIY